MAHRPARSLGTAAGLGLPATGYTYVTLHRPSNVDDPGRLVRLVAMLGRWGRGSCSPTRGACRMGEEIERVLPLVDEVLAGRYKKGQPIPGWDGRAAERVAAALAERYGGPASS